MEPSPERVPYRRIGTILVEMGLLAQSSLDSALDEQRRTGRLLGELLVAHHGVSRVDLADALAAQWAEAQSHAASTTTSGNGVSLDQSAADEGMEEGDLRVLLEEAQAARAELTARTDELSRRVASLEALVVGVSDALDELRAIEPKPQDHTGAHRTTRRGRPRATRR